jgi:hypothetical protein
MTTYERVTVQSPAQRGRARRLFLRDVAETTFAGVPAITGVEVDREGDEVQPSKAYLKAHGAEDGERRHILPTELVTKREPHVVDYLYGTLVPDGTASQQRSES